MPKYRQLHTKIIDSFDFNEMPDDFCRVTWMLLPIILDSEGRGIDHATWVRSKMYPMRPDVTDAQVSAALDWLAGRGMIIRYAVGNRGYFYIPTWKDYQSGTEKEAESKIPPPAGQPSAEPNPCPASPPDRLPAPANSEPTLELLPTNSGVTPDPLQRNSASISITTASTSAKAKAKAKATAAAADSAPAAQKKPAAAAEVPRPEVFAVYEREIGLITPIIAENLREFTRQYPPGWPERAIREAVTHGKRNLAYVSAILRRWKADGLPANGTACPECNRVGTHAPGCSLRYVTGEFQEFIER